MAKRTTLTDIAKVAGVTPATVQRALKGIEGVGEEQRKRIRQIAGEMDYKPNMFASALKKGKLRIAVVLPSTEKENRFYAVCLWEGVRKYLEEKTEFEIQGYEFPYERSPENLGLAMRQMYDRMGGELDGVITMGAENMMFRETLARLESQKTPYVFVGTDLKDSGRLCCVSAYDEITGSSVADLFLNFQNQDGAIILTGDFNIEDQNRNAQGFEKQIQEGRRRFEIIRLSNYHGIEATTKTLRGFLETGMKIAGIYSCSARNTIAMCRAIEESGRQVAAVGSDVFPENVELMRQGKLAAIIHKRPYDQAYRAAQILLDYILKDQKPMQDTERAVPIIVMKSNLECFIENANTKPGLFW